MVKKLLAFTTIAVLIFGVASAFAESYSDTMEIQSKLLSNVDASASDWYASEEMQALFCAAAMMDVVLADNSLYTDTIISALSEGRCFIGKSGLTLSAYYFGKDYIVLLTYKPLTKSLEAGIIEISAIKYADSVMDHLKSSGDLVSYLEVETSDVTEMAQLVLEAVS